MYGVPFPVNVDSSQRGRGVQSEFLHSFLGHKQLGAPGFVFLQGIGVHWQPPAPITPNVTFRGAPFFGDDDPTDTKRKASP